MRRPPLNTPAPLGINAATESGTVLTWPSFRLLIFHEILHVLIGLHGLRDELRLRLRRAATTADRTEGRFREGTRELERQQEGAGTSGVTPRVCDRTAETLREEGMDISSRIIPPG